MSIGLRFKLAAGFGALLALLLATGWVSLALLSRNASTLDRILRENFESVGYGQGMKDALEQARLALREQGRGPRLESARAEFRRELGRERRNLTVPGERELADSLDRSWSRLDSQFAAGAPLPESVEEVRRLSQRVIDLNLGNILSADGRVRTSHERERGLLLLLLAGGALLAIAWSVWASRWIVRPLRVLTESVREVGNRNLDLVVAVGSRDEVGELAQAFNAMASRLREYRDSDRQRLLRVHRTTQMAVDSLPDAVVVATPGGSIELANGAARHLFGLQETGNVAGLAGGRIDELLRQAVRTAQPAQPRSYEDAIQVFDGGERFFLPKALPILDSRGEVAGVTVVLADVTQLRRLEELRSGALSVVAHELRTPLTSLRMSAHLLLDERVGALSAKQSELVETVAEEGGRLQRIVDELLDVARLDAGRTALERVPRDPEDLLRRAAAEWEGGFREKDVQISLACAPGLPRIEVDPVRISHALSNLLSNALRHTPPGGRVALGATLEAGQLVVDVSDSGPGIPPEHLGRIFERFYRAPGQSAAGGVGLGLPIVREIVLAHGGSVEASNAPEGGARFRIRLPLPSGIGSPVDTGTDVDPRGLSSH